MSAVRLVESEHSLAADRGENGIVRSHDETLGQLRACRKTKSAENDDSADRGADVSALPRTIRDSHACREIHSIFGTASTRQAKA